MQLQFVKSAHSAKDYPVDHVKEIALVGRSNAGKSSFLNAVANQKIAKVSQTPGKTQLLNFFIAGEKYRFVDMPGYGYAKRSAKEVNYWAKMIEEYIQTRSNLAGLLLIMDIRRLWSEDEQMILSWMEERQLPLAVVLTKADKFGFGKQKQARVNLSQKLSQTPVFSVSSLKKKGMDEVEEFVYKNWIEREGSES